MVPIAAVSADSAPIAPGGYFDAVTTALDGAGWSINALGWALDPAEPARSLPIRARLYTPTGAELPLGAQESTDASVAGGARPDVANVVAGAGAAHGFEVTRRVNFGGLPFANPVTVCVDALVSRSGAQMLSRIGCSKVVLVRSRWLDRSSDC